MNRKTETLRRLQPYIERARRFSGWSFSDVKVQPLEPGPPWDYDALARKRARQAESVLDMGTGGGERLSRIVAGLQTCVTATEDWEVNAPVARQRLAPLGIPVVRCQSVQLPFADASFDLVLNRHEELEPAEAVRVLQPDGCIVTQQVGRDDWHELGQFFPRKQDSGDLLGTYASGFEAAEMSVSRAIHNRKVAFESLGDFVFMLLITPWTIPSFDPEGDIEALLGLEEACGSADGVVLTESRYLIVAERGGMSDGSI